MIFIHVTTIFTKLPRSAATPKISKVKYIFSLIIINEPGHLVCVLIYFSEVLPSVATLFSFPNQHYQTTKVRCLSLKPENM